MQHMIKFMVYRVERGGRARTRGLRFLFREVDGRRG